MKAKNISILAVFISIIITSCSSNLGSGDSNSDDNYRVVTISDKYEMKIPKFMKQTSDLNNDASLQYMNPLKEVYVVVIDEPKNQLIETFTDLEEYDPSLSVAQNYRDIQMGFMSEGFNILNKSESKNIVINGLDAEYITLDAQVEGIDEDIAYFLTFIEGKENVHMSMMWTFLSRKEKFKETFEKMIYSFNEIGDKAESKSDEEDSEL